MHRWVNISFYPWHCFSSQERKQREAKFKPNADITLSSKRSHWGASQLHLLGPPKRPLNNKPHSGASLNFILRILHLIYMCLVSAKSKCHTRQGLYNKYTHWAITCLDWFSAPVRCDPRGLPDPPPIWPTSNRLAWNKKVFFFFYLNVCVCMHICTCV